MHTRRSMLCVRFFATRGCSYRRDCSVASPFQIGEGLFVVAIIGIL